jgi:hypothetical protein
MAAYVKEMVMDAHALYEQCTPYGVLKAHSYGEA